jgi:hypothetical protein
MKMSASCLSPRLCFRIRLIRAGGPLAFLRLVPPAAWITRATRLDEAVLQPGCEPYFLGYPPEFESTRVLLVPHEFGGHAALFYRTIHEARS